MKDSAHHITATVEKEEDVSTGDRKARVLEERAMSSALQKCVDCPNECQQPLTVFAKCRVKPEHLNDFEARYHDMIQMQKSRKGYLSSELIRPLSSDHEYVSIFRYDTYAHLQAWMDSAERRQMLEKIVDFIEAPLLVSYHSLEYWFVEQGEEEDGIGGGGGGGGGQQQRKPPSKHKMMLVTIAVIFSQTQWVPLVINRIAPKLNLVVSQLLTVSIIVLIVTYIVFPIVTRLLAFWLFPEATYREQLLQLVPSWCCCCKQEQKSSEHQGEPRSAAAEAAAAEDESGSLGEEKELPV